MEEPKIGISSKGLIFYCTQLLDIILPSSQNPLSVLNHLPNEKKNLEVIKLKAFEDDKSNVAKGRYNVVGQADQRCQKGFG